MIFFQKLNCSYIRKNAHILGNWHWYLITVHWDFTVRFLCCNGSKWGWFAWWPVANLIPVSIVASTACQTKHTELLSNEWVQFYTTINIYRLKTLEILSITYQFWDQFLVEAGKIVATHSLRGIKWNILIVFISQGKWSFYKVGNTKKILQ